MYTFFCGFLPGRLADAVMIAWYLLLFVLIYVLSVEQEAGFLYQGL